MSKNKLSPELYVVMDGRAQYDTDAAMVLEACGSKRPKMENLSRSWGQQGAMLVRWYAPKDGVYTEKEIIGVIP